MRASVVVGGTVSSFDLTHELLHGLNWRFGHTVEIRVNSGSSRDFLSY
jgi:hypothetical protein